MLEPAREGVTKNVPAWPRTLAGAGDMIDRHQQRQTIRSRVLAVIEAAPRPLTGKEVAQAAGIPYKPAIDALNKLYDYGKVRRTGAKFTVRWSVNQSPLSNAESADLLTRIMLAMSLKSRGK